MKQVSNLPFLGIVKDKKWCPFFHSGVRRPIFLHPKSLKMAVFECKKWFLVWDWALPLLTDSFS